MEEQRISHKIDASAIIGKKACYSVDDLMIILDAGRGTIYELLRSNAFPSIRLGSRGKYRIPAKGFEDWLEKQI